MLESLPAKDRALIGEATELAAKRPVRVQAMPSVANSSCELTGPVVIDPLVPEEYRKFLALHETVEQLLMSRAHYSYVQAHKIATLVEARAVRAAGIPWSRYREWFATHEHEIEEQQVDPNTYAGLDLHVDPEDAIGHHHKGAH